MSETPLFESGDIFLDEDNEDLFASAIDIEKEKMARPPSTNPLPELRTLQLTVDKTPVMSPIDELNQDSTGLQSPPPVQKKQTNPPKAQNGNGDHYLDIKITECTIIGEGMGAYVVFKIETNTNIPNFRSTTTFVQRRFSDFLGLHDKLTDKYLRHGRIIPPTPEKSVIGMTKIKMSGQAEVNSSNEFLERRRASLERYLQRTASHPVFCMDPDFHDFLQNEGELPRATNTSALSGAGVMRLFSKVGETVNKITYRMDESDTWFEIKTTEVERLETGLRKLHYSAERLVLARKELAAFTGAVAKSSARLSIHDGENRSLASALVALTELQEKVEALHNEQANTDFSVLCELLKDYIALIGAIKCVFHERVKVFQNWEHSKQMLNKKREYKAKMEISNRPDKGNIAAKKIEEWEAKVQRCEEEFNNISKMIKTEMERFEEIRVHDFKLFFTKYMEQQLQHQQELIKYWEAFLPAAKAIA